MHAGACPASHFASLRLFGPSLFQLAYVRDWLTSAIESRPDARRHSCAGLSRLSGPVTRAPVQVCSYRKGILWPRAKRKPGKRFHLGGKLLRGVLHVPPRRPTVAKVHANTTPRKGKLPTWDTPQHATPLQQPLTPCKLWYLRDRLETVNNLATEQICDMPLCCTRVACVSRHMCNFLESQQVTCCCRGGTAAFCVTKIYLGKSGT